MDQMLVLQQRFADAETALREQQARVKEILAELKNDPLHIRYYDAVDALASTRRAHKDAETALCVAALKVYAATKAPQIAPGVKIRERMVIDFDETDAIAWCVQQRCVTPLRLDKEIFIKMVMTDSRIHCATTRREPFVVLEKERNDDGNE